MRSASYAAQPASVYGTTRLPGDTSCHDSLPSNETATTVSPSSGRRRLLPRKLPTIVSSTTRCSPPFVSKWTHAAVAGRGEAEVRAEVQVTVRLADEPVPAAVAGGNGVVSRSFSSK